jgi:hypothetical protein
MHYICVCVCMYASTVLTAVRHRKEMETAVRGCVTVWGKRRSTQFIPAACWLRVLQCSLCSLRSPGTNRSGLLIRLYLKNQTLDVLNTSANSKLHFATAISTNRTACAIYYNEAHTTNLYTWEERTQLLKNRRFLDTVVHFIKASPFGTQMFKTTGILWR